MWKVMNSDGERICGAFLKIDAVMKAMRKGMRDKKVYCVENDGEMFIPLIWKKSLLLSAAIPMVGAIYASSKIKSNMVLIENYNEINNYDFTIEKNGLYEKRYSVKEKGDK